MNDYVIITDATCDLRPDIVKKFDIGVIPMDFILNGKPYLHYYDARNLGYKEFYERLRNGETAVTSQVSINSAISTFEEVLDAGKDVFYISFTSGMSSSYQSVSLFTQDLKDKYPDRKIVVIDSLCASGGEGLLVYLAAIEKSKGMNIDDLAKWVENNKMKVNHWVTVDDLSHLKRGGRISATSAFAGTVLGIKPQIKVDDNGKLIVIDKVRTRKKGLSYLVDKMKEYCINPNEQVIFLNHADCPEDADYVASLINENFKVKELIIHFIGPVIGAHAGAGTVALFFLADHR